MSDQDKINVSLIEHVSNDPNASGRDEVMTAEAIGKIAGRLPWELIIADKIAIPNMRYISTGQHTITLPNPEGTYISRSGNTIDVAVGDVIVIEQLQDFGAVVAHDDSYAEIFDTAGGSRRTVFEVMPDEVGDGREWRQIVTGTGNVGGGGGSFTGGNVAGVKETRTFHPIHIAGTPISFEDDTTQKYGKIDLADFTGRSIPANATHVQLRVQFNTTLTYASISGSANLSLYIGNGTDGVSTTIASAANKVCSTPHNKSNDDGQAICSETVSVTVEINRTSTDNLTWVMPVAESLVGTIDLMDRAVIIVVEGYWINEARPVGLGGTPLDLVGHTIYPIDRNLQGVTVANWNDSQVNINLETATGVPVPDGATHAIVKLRLGSHEAKFTSRKVIYGDRYTGASVSQGSAREVCWIDTMPNTGEVYGETTEISYVPITVDAAYHISLRVLSEDAIETNTIAGISGYDYSVLGYLVLEQQFTTYELNPAVGKILTGVNAGGSNWTFPDLDAVPRTATIVFVNGLLEDPANVGWFALQLAVPGTTNQDSVKLMVFVDPAPLGEAELLGNSGNVISSEYIDYQGVFFSGTTFSITGLSEEPTNAYNVYADGIRVKKSNLTWSAGGRVSIAAPAVNSGTDVVLSLLSISVTPTS